MSPLFLLLACAYTPPLDTAAEPTLNAWAGRLLGAFRKVRFAVERVDASGAVVKSSSPGSPTRWWERVPGWNRRP